MFERITLPDGMLPPVAPYCHATRAGDFLFVTGQLAENPETGEMMLGDIRKQTHQVMKNLQLVLQHAKADLRQTVMARIFVTDMRYYQDVNDIYRSYFQAGEFPCRTTVGVLGLAGLGDVEIDLIIYCGSAA